VRGRARRVVVVSATSLAAWEEEEEEKEEERRERLRPGEYLVELHLAFVRLCAKLCVRVYCATYFYKG